ncbi:MAG: trypsin-like peptidase domain-containing protein [Chthoniobacteraceae bacterium]
MRLAWIAICLLVTQIPSRAISISEVRKSLVHITTTSQDANYRVPWNPGSVNSGSGTGFIIDGKRILTNAHVVANARYISVERENDPKRYEARVEHVGHDCDLAVLTVSEAGFFDGTVALRFTNQIPAIESSVSVYGYPIGGDRLSVTTGVVSRIAFQSYAHSAADSHLAIQTNAAINPGNSGGPVLQDGKVIGIAFQGFNGEVAQNVGYMIPVPVVSRFLKDLEDGHYDRYMDLSISTFDLLNPAQRKSLGLADDGRGVLVGSVIAGGVADGVLKAGDVILSIDGHSVQSDGFVELEGERVEMPEIIERKFKGDTASIHIIRAKEPQDVTIQFTQAWPFQIQSNQYEVKPRYILFGGLLFQPVSRNFLEETKLDNLRVRYLYDFYTSDQVFKDRPDIIVLSAVLPDPVNTYLGSFRGGIVEKINGVKIRTLDEMAGELAKPAQQYVIKLLGEGRPIVMERAAVEAARERILGHYNVRNEQNLSE